MKVYPVKTKGYEVELFMTFICTKKCRVKVIGYDPKHKNTVYFDTAFGTDQKLFKGKKEFSIKLPLSPEVLHIKAFDEATKTDLHIALTDVKIKPLVKKGLWKESKYTKGFLTFATSFCEKAGYLPLKTYNVGGDNGYFIIFDDVVRNRKTKQYVETPASVGGKTGVVMISKKHFDDFTIPMRVMIMCHEWSHHILQTMSEYEADKKGLQLYLDMGFPEIEAVYSLTKVFNNGAINGEKIRRAEIVKNFIVNYSK